MPTLDLPARVHSTTVISGRTLAENVSVVTLDAAELAHAVRAGQYVMAIPPNGETPATPLAVYEAEGRHASILFFITGKRTQELATLRAGDRLDVVGPLGNGFDCSGDARDVAIVAGGVGIASVLLCAQAVIQRGANVRLFYGARTAQLLVDSQRFADIGCEVIAATDDGSSGARGFITDVFERAALPEAIYACGPSPMLRAVGRIAARMRVRAQLSLEETFGCGVGGCWGCVVPLAASSAQAPAFPPASQGGSDTVNARICKEGPVFWSDELRW